MFSSKDLFFTPTSGAYTVSKSLRFRSSATAYLSKATFATPTDNKKWTWSAWVKIGTINPWAGLFYGGGIGTSQPLTELYLYTDGTLYYQTYNGSVNTGLLQTTQVFRDPSAWYHIVLVIDIANATPNNRQRIYVNGAEVTAISSRTNHGTSDATYFNNASYAGYIGESFPVSGTAAKYFDGYMADINFIDGQALAPSSFGAYDTNGIWQPAAYTGSYGTNGFYLKFTTVGATSGSNTGYGQDFSGNGNYWTTNNFGTTSTSVDYDSMLDSPTNATGDIGNYPVLNPLQSGAYVSQTNGNLTNTGNTATNSALVLATIGNLTSGKWYWEYTQGTVSSETCGIVTTYTPGTSLINGENIGAFGIGARASGSVYGGTVGTITSWTNGDIIGLAVDCDNGAIYWSKNGTWLNSGVPTSGSSKTGAVGTWTPSSSINVTPAFGAYNGGFVSVTFGQRPFTYTPPSGFSALNTQNLTTPTITNGASYMAAVTYTGTGSSQTITASSTNSGNNPNGTTFQPDWVWVKGRSGATDHALYDAVRGVQLQLESNTTGAETTETTGLTAFTSSGFTTGALAQMNTNTATYVAWEWNAGGSNATNTTGTIQSTVRANTSAGFSVVTATAPASGSFTIGHGLGVTPGMIIVKATAGGIANWAVWHTSIGSGYYLTLNSTNAQTSTTYWGTMTSSLISFAATNLVNASSAFVCYAFAPVAGYSAFGSYTGNSSTDGPFVYTGFRPRWIMIKRTDAANDWVMYDSSRSTYNVNNLVLAANSSSNEATYSSGYNLDFVSNGVKIKDGPSGAINTSGGTYIYAAFAENPFKISRAR